MRTYPSLAKAAAAFGLSETELQAKLGDLNPINHVDVLARHKVPIFIIHGDDDKVVPLKQNSAELVARYKAAGQENTVTLIVAEGQGHNLWEGFFHCQPLVDFVIARAKAK
jgi:pimeloyl-ACP methyl ester carboxylesterase